jgi:hypothetical protein
MPSTEIIVKLALAGEPTAQAGELTTVQKRLFGLIARLGADIVNVFHNIPQSRANYEEDARALVRAFNAIRGGQPGNITVDQARAADAMDVQALVHHLVHFADELQAARHPRTGECLVWV